MSEPAAALTAEQLVYRFPGQEPPALQGVDLRLERGQAVGLLGPNGSGKSTLISLLAGLRPLQGGRIVLGGRQRAGIAWVPQEYAFYPDLTCRENLRFFAAVLPLEGADAGRKVAAAIDACMLAEFADRRARHCSGGVRRRLNIAIALLQEPEILLLDEPTTGVDPQSRAFLLEQVRGLVERGTAVLYATHYMEEVSAVCSHIVLLDHGKVLSSGGLASLLNPPDAPPFASLEALFMHHTQRSLRD